MKIHRKDLVAPADVEFVGNFGEEPAVYRFARGADGRFVAEVGDPIAVHRLLSIRGYEAADPTEEAPPAPDVTAKPEPAHPLDPTAGPLPPAPPMDINEARVHYAQVVGKKPFNGWDIAELLTRIDEHNKG